MFFKQIYFALRYRSVKFYLIGTTKQTAMNHFPETHSRYVYQSTSVFIRCDTGRHYVGESESATFAPPYNRNRSTPVAVARWKTPPWIHNRLVLTTLKLLLAPPENFNWKHISVT